MKKTYINPTTFIFAVRTQQHMLIGSPIGTNAINGGGSKGDFNSTTMEQASRQGGSLWEDEEE